MLGFIIETIQLSKGVIPAIPLSRDVFVRDEQMSYRLARGFVFEIAGDTRRAAEGRPRGELLADFHIRVWRRFDAAQQLDDQAIGQNDRRVALFGAAAARRERALAANGLVCRSPAHARGCAFRPDGLLTVERLEEGLRRPIVCRRIDDEALSGARDARNGEVSAIGKD